MLEKIGLPAKPSERGNNWVVDATHCQGCSSQFTFINRKHHCRRCGGLFCNSCTQQRMFLRGQGDSPVRICDPCKKLEEAARFEMRHGHKNRAAKGSSKTPSENVDDILNQLLANDSQEPSTLRRDFHTGSSKEATGEDGEVDMLEKGSNDETNHAHNEVASVSPEVLRQKAVDEKSKYKILKREGKSAEALKAFKTAKELERQAASLELQLRKSRRKALASTSTAEAHKTEDVSQGSSKKNKIDPQKGKEKDDMTAELRALGWSDNDIHGTDQKPATSLESELLNLTGDDSRKKNNNKTVDGTDKSEVVALKKKALMLKREGKLAEAKEELKKAKILEKQLEEQEFLAEAEDSGDEISALIRSLDSDGQDDSSMGMGLESGIDLRSLMGDAGDLGMDGIFEVTDDDMHDPELAAALKNMGWDEESNEPYATVTGYVSTDRDAIENEIGRLKKEAVHQKRTGNVAEAMSLLKKAKVLEKDLEGLSSYEMGPSDSQASENAQEVSQFEVMVDRKPERKTRAMIQKELLALKKKALALRREGKLDEAEAELKKGKILEQQLEEIDNATTMKITQVNVTREVSRPRSEHPNISAADTSLDVEEDVTDQDMHDPAYLVLLKNLGWQDDDNKPMVSSTDVSEQKAVSGPRRSKGEIQRELLSLKRKALTLRRQGQDAEAEEVLRSAKVLEEQMAEMEAAVQGVSAGVSGQRDEIESAKKGSLVDVTEPKEDKTDEPLLERRAEPEDSSGGGESANHVDSASAEAEKGSVQTEILVHKRKAVALKREGKLAEAREELRKAKLLERTLEEEKSQPPPSSTVVEVSKSSIPAAVKDEHNPSRLAPKPMSSHDRFKLQRECLSHKRNALKLRREGKTAEAEAELDLAKKLEAQLNEVNPHEPMDSSREPGSVDDVGVEDFLDPQILSALNAIGLQDAPAASHAPTIAEPSSSQERVKLEAEIKAEKVKALNLKRTGKQAEALDALRKAKQLEKKLNSLPS